MTMEIVTVPSAGGNEIDYAVITNDDGSQISMLKSIYEEQQTKQGTLGTESAGN